METPGIGGGGGGGGAEEGADTAPSTDLALIGDNGEGTREAGGGGGAAKMGAEDFGDV